MTRSRGLGLLAILLVVSVGINLFLAGNEIGPLFRRSPSTNFETRIELFLESLPDADRAIAMAIVDKRRPDILDKLKLYRAASQTAIASLRADQLSVDVVRANIDKVNETATEFRKSIQDAMIEIAGKISPAGRAHLRAVMGGF